MGNKMYLQGFLQSLAIKVTDIIELNLNAAEKELFQKSVTQLKQVMASLQPNA